MNDIATETLFSHLLRDTMSDVNQLDMQAESETSEFFSKKRVSLTADLIDDLKTFIYASEKSASITELGREMYARVLSEERGYVVTVAEANKILNQEVEDMENANWTAVPKAIFQSMENGDTQFTQSIFDQWYLLISVFSRDGIDAYDIERATISNLKLMMTAVHNVCLKYEGYYKEHVEMDSEDNETKSYIPEIYEPDLDGLYSECVKKHVDSVDLWLGIKQVKDVTIPALEQINALVGQAELKIIANNLSRIHQSGISGLKDQFLDVNETAMTLSRHHTVLTGNSGVGKTTVARLLGQLHYENGTLSKGHIVEVSAKDLIANVVGGTAIKTGVQIAKAKGGILFIDEGYQLFEQGSRHNFAAQAVTELLTAMENEDDIVIILAGYKDPMEKLLTSNIGLPRRVRYVLDCKDYDVPELMQVLDCQLKQRGLEMTDAARKIFEDNMIANKDAVEPKFWSNAGFVRDYLSNVVVEQELRVANSKALIAFQETGKASGVRKTLRTITIEDVKKAIPPVPDFLKSKTFSRPIGFRLTPNN